MPLPTAGLSADEIAARIAPFASDVPPHRDLSRARGGPPEVQAAARAALLRLLDDDAEHPASTPGVLALEQQLVALVADHMGGDAAATGDIAASGAEAALLVVQAARDHARAHRPNVDRPNLVLPATAHARYQKACQTLGVEARVVDVDPQTLRAGPDGAARQIDEQTVLVVGSAPSAPHGVVDDIAGLAGLASERGVWMHVDAGEGGWLLPHLRRLGRVLPPCDLSVEGVTSLSVDLHGAAACPLGATALLYRSAALRAHQLQAHTGWTGAALLYPTVLGSRSGGPIAAAWATLHALGDAGYLDRARVSLEATQRLRAGLDRIAGLEVMGQPEACHLAVSSAEVPIFEVVDAMRARGWRVRPQLGYRVHRETLLLVVHPAVADHIPALLEALEQSVAEARALPPLDDETLQAALQHVDAERLSDERFAHLLTLAGASDRGLPERTARLNGLLHRLPPAMADALLVRMFNQLHREG